MTGDRVLLFYCIVNAHLHFLLNLIYMSNIMPANLRNLQKPQMFKSNLKSHMSQIRFFTQYIGEASTVSGASEPLTIFTFPNYISPFLHEKTFVGT